MRARARSRTTSPPPFGVLAGLITALVVGGVRPAPAQSRDELLAATRRLLSVEAALEPLPDTGLTRDVGQIAIIEHDGSNYDARLEDGTLNYEARTRVGRRFYETHGDEYDFLVVFSNFDFKTSDATAFHLFGRNAVHGIGKFVGEAAPEVFGSPARLKGWVDMASVAQYRDLPFSLTPGELGFLRTLDVLAHEVGHQWLAEARFLDEGRLSEALLGRGGNHWSYLLDSDASLMYGADWRDNGDGTYTAVRVKDRYSALDRYLMGFLAPDEVGPLTLLQNPGIDPEQINQEDAVISATPTTVLIEQLVAAMGPRQPDERHSQKEFRLGFVFLTTPGTEPNPEDLEAVERVRRAFGAHFFALTHGVAWAEASLTPPLVLPPAPAPDLGRALAWLVAQQALDGSWADSPGTSVRDTAAAVRALARAGATGPGWQHGLLWLQQVQSESLDFGARRDTALAGLDALGGEGLERATVLLARQNSDGGFGAGLDFASDALDTALALRALRALGQPPDARVRAAVRALGPLAGPDGGWAAVPGGETSIVVTAEALLALLDWPDVPESSALQASGLAALLARQNEDGGFGTSPSTPFASALALEVLLRSGGPSEVIDPLVAWLQGTQLADGSWNGSPFQTALVLGGLKESLGANLVVPAETLLVSPSPAQEGDVVQVTALVRNVGRSAAPASVARLFEGDPGASPSLAEAPAPALAPSQDALVTFDFPTTDRPGLRTLFVVADAGDQVPESREDDNTTSRALTVVGLLADLVVTAADIVVTPAAPEVGEDVTIIVTVTNLGERASGESRLRLTLTHPVGGTTVLPDALTPPLGPGESAGVVAPWTPTSPGQLLLRATVDADYEVPESDETNGAAEREVEVLASAPEGADLAIRAFSLTPATLEELPQALEARVLVENKGRSPATTTVTVLDEEGTVLASTPLELAPRSGTTTSLPVTIATPGSQWLEAEVDPDDAIPEENEDDNFADVLLEDAHTLDVGLVEGSITLSSDDVELGEPVAITVEVRNHGTLDVPDVPLQLSHAAPTGRVELVRTQLSLPPGTSQVVTLDWRASILGEAVNLVLHVDPFDLLSERSEEDNVASLSLRVRPSGLPNLAASGADISTEPDPPRENEAATVLAVVRNTGVVPAGPFVVRFLVGLSEEEGTPIGEVSLGGLDPESATTVSASWDPVNVRGSVGLFAVVDALGEVAESDESDNVAFRPVVATGLPDLVMGPADVLLEPAYPRAGEEVTIRATVHNLGGLPSLATALAFVEGELTTGTELGVLPVPPLEPGVSATLLLPWIPSAPPGERRLSLLADPEDLVIEQDEGNNHVRRTVVVQDADLFLTEPWFSPNGDGIKDETTLAWRAAGAVQVVVSNERGEVVRSLEIAPPGSGLATWDGRDERGAIAVDGPYTLAPVGEGGAPFGQKRVVLDTNRSALHDASPVEIAVRNATCLLPDRVSNRVWMPGEDELLVLIQTPSEGFPIGLVRAGLDNTYSYVVTGDWLGGSTHFIRPGGVSPDGREVLLMVSGDLVALDLTTGTRRTLGGWTQRTVWSPDGRWILADQRVLARDGTLHADLEGLQTGWYASDWDWSPGSDRLAAGNTIASRDGELLARIPVPQLPDGPDPEEESARWGGTTWRGDGRIVSQLDVCDEGGGDECFAWYVINPDDETARDLGWWPATWPTWSPDGRRALVSGELFENDGRHLGRLLLSRAEVAPHSSAATYTKSSQWNPEIPGHVCGDKDYDLFAVTTLANLTADLRVARLPGNNGLVLRGTADDRNLDRFEVDYARKDDPDVWYAIGPAAEVPVRDDQFAVWVPREPGTYVVRLRVYDRAGNARTRTRIVSWDHVPSIANYTQDAYFISPAGNGPKKAVTVRFLVVEPTRLDVRVVGPEPTRPGAPAAREVRRAAFEYSEFGPGEYTWDGRDESGAVVADGRYTVFLNELPFRVAVDSTPPELGLRFENLHTREMRYAGEVCTAFGTEGPSSVELATVVGDRRWHVFDAHLRSWVLTAQDREIQSGTEGVYEAETDENDLPILDAGIPRVIRQAGRPVDRSGEDSATLWLAQHPGFQFAAEDHAGNRSEVTVPPVPEGVWTLGAANRCTDVLRPPVEGEGDVEPPDSPTVHALAPEKIVLVAGAALNRDAAEQDVHFSFQPQEGGPWRDIPMSELHRQPEWFLPIESFEALGADPIATYRGRFVGNGAAGDVSSDSFLFRPCAEWANTWVIPDAIIPILVLETLTSDPVVEAWVDLRVPGEMTETVQMAPGGDGVFWAFVRASCNGGEYQVRGETASGHSLGQLVPSSCARLRGPLPVPASCEYLRISQEFRGCEGSSDNLYLRVEGGAAVASRVEIEKGEEGAAVPVASFTVPGGNFTEHIVADARDRLDGPVSIRGRMLPLDPPPGPDPEPIEAVAEALVDRTPPVAEILLPPEGGLLCESRGDAGSFINIRALAADASPRLEVEAQVRPPDGPWTIVPRTCLDEACQRDPSVPSGLPVELAFGSAALPAGDYEAQVGFCDRSGNRGWAPRNFSLTREAQPRVISVSPHLISPNGDGRADSMDLVVRLPEAVELTVQVHRGTVSGSVVRTLQDGQPHPATDAQITWDGQGDGGQPVSDGLYVVVFSTRNACGGLGTTSTRVEVDTTAPDVAIVNPVGDQNVAATVDVQGHVTDTNLALWQLETACGSPDEWSLVATNRNQVAPESVIAAWDTSRAPPGPCTLRLSAEDEAENRGEVVVPVQVGGGVFIGRLVAAPDIFSPNGDSRRETTRIEYTLERTARVTLLVRDENGGPLIALVENEVQTAGERQLDWDGLDSAASPAPEGDLEAWLRAEDPDDAAVYDERGARVTLDRTAPALALTTPVPDTFVSAARPIHGSIGDPHLLEYVLTVTPAGGAATELARDSRTRSDEDLAPLAAFGDGPHTLDVTASDLAENRADLTIPFTIDSTPPIARLIAPATGAGLTRGEEPVPVTGTATDENLESWTLRFGAGSEPTVFTTIATGAEGGDAIALADWNVAFVPDGVHTLSLVVTDRAGNTAEARATVTLDSQPPRVMLDEPEEGSYVIGPDAIYGTVTDTNLASWQVDVAPGDAATAFQWAPLAAGTETVEADALGDWAPLPPDGIHTLRLTGRDAVDLTATTTVTVTVDTTPPAMPTGLDASVTPGEEGYGQIRLTWNPNTEPDLAGYRVALEGREDDPAEVDEPSWDDGEHPEGRYTYSVVAVDEAGHESPPATLLVLVDLTPPVVDFLSPAENASVAGIVEVRGTAHSTDDFAEYRLLVGAGEEPSSWTLLRRSTVPVAAGRLGEWLALADGPYVLALEAEDTRGNMGRVTRPVTVDTVPPEPPILVEVARPPTPVDRLTPTWQASPSEDVDGYLVYRNARVANAESLVLGDLRGFLVPGPSHDDDSLPDGEHCYTVEAMDGAGNTSAPSNQICVSLDNRAPHALIVQPEDGTRFGHPLRVVAETPDLDVAGVLFERRDPGGADWIGFGNRASAPWEVTLDPTGLVLGEHDIRAVATDEAGNTDPAPAAITVVFGDTSPPEPPLGLVARVDGADVALTWEPSGAPDFAHYRVYRDGEQIAGGLTDPVHADPGLEPELYSYTVTAVDADDNESAPSLPADAVVYALRLDPPPWPVVAVSLGTVTGDGSRPGTTVKVEAGGATVAETPAAGGVFQVEGVPLVPDGNVLRARGEDAEGNRSVPSNEIVLIANAPPGPVASLQADVDGDAVTLSWPPVTDTDLFGYVVRRDDDRLSETVRQEEALSIVASENSGHAARAFDQNPSTVWRAVSPPAEWRVVFPTPVLVERLQLRFAPADELGVGPPARYRVLARWQGRDLPIIEVRDNDTLIVDHPLPMPFATDSLLVVLEAPGRVAEVEVFHLDVAPPGAESFLDEPVPDGAHTYAVAAIDRYGAEGPAAVGEAPVGDVDPPAAPTGLEATPDGRDVALSWDENTEPDVTGYVVVRDGSRIGTSPGPAYRDEDLANGTYVYTVIAVDTAGHESPESLPDDATVDVAPAPPAAPVILEPTDAANPITLDWALTEVAGRADPGTVVSLEVNGEPRGSAAARPGFALAGEGPLSWYRDVALSPDGRLAAWPTYTRDSVSVQDLTTGEVRLLPHGGNQGSYTHRFSPDGRTLAMVRQSYVPGSGYITDVVRLGVTDGTIEVLADRHASDLAWSPDGTSLAVSFLESPGSSVHVLEVETADSVEVHRSTGTDQWLRWSPDGSRLAFVRTWYGEASAAELRIGDLVSGRTTRLDARAWRDSPPSWSPDGRLVAWTTEDGSRHIRVHDTTTGEDLPPVAFSGSDAQDPRFSPTGEWLSFVHVTRLPEGWDTTEIAARHEGSGVVVPVVELGSTPRVHEWIEGHLTLVSYGWLERHAPMDGRFVFPSISLVPGENHLVARATDPATGLVSPDSETVIVTVPESTFPNLTVATAGIQAWPPAPVLDRPGELRVRVDNVGAEDAWDIEVGVGVRDPDGLLVVDSVVPFDDLDAGTSAVVSVPWTPEQAGSHTVLVTVDPDSRVPETREDDNTAERVLLVAESDDLVAAIGADRSTYGPGETAIVSVTVANAGRPFAGEARTVVEDDAGTEVAVLDERPVALEYGEGDAWTLTWPTGTTWAGSYRFRVGVRAEEDETDRAEATHPFVLEAAEQVALRVRPEPAIVPAGASVAFGLAVDNTSPSAPLEGATLRLTVQPEGSPGPAAFETVRGLPTLLPGAAWETTDVWPAAQPPGRHIVTLTAQTSGGVVLAQATAVLTVGPGAPVMVGSLEVVPAHVILGEAAEAEVTLANEGTLGVVTHPVSVDVVSGPDATVLVSAATTVDLAAGEQQVLSLTLETGGLTPGTFVALLRAGAPPISLARDRLTVHGPIAPPSPHAPADGGTVDNAHPTLEVNNASSADDAPRTYAFQLFGDAALTQPLPGATGIAEEPDRTAWRVASELAEDTTYWWRAQATDGFSLSPWSAVTSFTVDALNRPPQAPVPDTPGPDARVASRQPALTVRNAVDPEGAPLLYEFRLAVSAEMTDIVTSITGVPEGLGLTSWMVPVVLEENALYYWTSRASDGVHLSAWTTALRFRVDTVNESPTPPRPLRPVDGDDVAILSPTLVVENATDPEEDPLSYRFEIDVVPSFDSSDLQLSASLPEGVDETPWTPAIPLIENTAYYWRAFASDGTAETSSVVASFFVNVANDPPSAPVPLDPVGGRAVGTATPTLRLRNATDPENDPLSYALVVRDASGSSVAESPWVPEDTDETEWTVPVSLAEDEDFTWTARATDGDLTGPPSAPAAFRVNAVLEPPTAPVPLLPEDQSILENARPTLVVQNATSPEGLPLVYAFELFVVTPGGPVLVEAASDVPEGLDTTAWGPSSDLADDEYEWRARASDPGQDGAWSATFRFEVRLDPPPAAPLGLEAIPGDARVRLDWEPSPEPDVVGYNVYRATTSGGPYDLFGSPATHGFEDLGLTNGVTYFYVVTAVDARAESEPSLEAAARPEAPQALVAEVRYDPSVLSAECLLTRGHGHRAEAAAQRSGRLRMGRAQRNEDCSWPPDPPPACPEWLVATLELPPGYDPSLIDLESLRLLGTVPADPLYDEIVDVDVDGLPERRVRFLMESVAPLLSVGANDVTVAGTAGAHDLEGAAPILVVPLSGELHVAPQTLNRRSKGKDILAKLTLAPGMPASEIDVSSVRLNDTVPVKRVVTVHDNRIHFKFDRAEVIAVLPLGHSVEVRVSGTLRGLPFEGVDEIKVIE